MGRARIRLDQGRAMALEELRARRAMVQMATGRRPPRRRRVPAQQTPRGQELRYRQMLLALVNEIERLITERLLPIVARGAAQVQQNRPDSRMDAPADDVADATARIREQLASRILSDNTLNMSASEIARDVSGFNRRQQDRIFEQTIGVGLPAAEPGLNDVLTGFSRDNTRLIKSLGGETLDRAQDEILRGFRRGRSNSEIARRIQEQTGIARNRARLIARDQVASLNGELTQIRQTRMGVTEYIWRTAGDERVRDSHEALDGRKFAWNDPPEEGHPGEPINCRCLAEPVLDPLFEGL